MNKKGPDDEIVPGRVKVTTEGGGDWSQGFRKMRLLKQAKVTGRKNKRNGKQAKKGGLHGDECRLKRQEGKLSPRDPGRSSSEGWGRALGSGTIGAKEPQGYSPLYIGTEDVRKKFVEVGKNTIGGGKIRGGTLLL